MSITLGLATLALRHVASAAGRHVGIDAGDAAPGSIVRWINARFTDHAARLPDALAHAIKRAWETVEYALAGDSLWNRCTSLFDRAEDKAFRREFREFLDSVPDTVLPDGAEAFRAACLAEIKAARKAGLLDRSAVDLGTLADHVAAFGRYSDPRRLQEAEFQTLDRMAEFLPERYVEMRKLLRFHPDGRTPLLVLAARYFFRRKIEADPQFAHGLAMEQMQAITDGQRQGFDALEAALASHGARLAAAMDETLELLGRTHAAVIGVQAGVIDIKSNVAEMRGELLGELRRFMHHQGIVGTRVDGRLGLTIRNDTERTFVRELLQRFRTLPPEAQSNYELLNGIGMAQQAAGDFETAEQMFHEAATAASDRAAAAEAHYNAYMAALESKDRPAALSSLCQAVDLDPDRFEPFPFYNYEPERIIGAGGFGVAFACRHVESDERVVVKTLSPSELQRDVAQVFKEARVLRDLNNSNIIKVRHGNFADRARTRPYLVMDYFDGVDLAEHVEKHGVLPPADVLSLAADLASALAAAHAKNILHLDVKPHNVLIRRSAAGKLETMLIDFGLAVRAEPAGANDKPQIGRSISGTLEYASPEQLGKLPGVKVGPKSDIHGFGKTCFYALFGTAQPSFEQFGEIEVWLAKLLDNCREHQPAKRPESFQVVADRLRDARNGEGKPAELAPAAAPHAVTSPPLPKVSVSPAAGPAPRTGMGHAGATPKDDRRDIGAAPVHGADPTFTNTIGMKFRRIEPGTFMMGDKDRPDAKPHEVTLTRPCMMGIHQVTQAQWKAVMGSDPSHFKGADLPVECVSWDDAVAFCEKLSGKEGRTYRLPTEAEWEYACRARTTTPYYTGGTIHTDQANYDGNYTDGLGGRKGVYREKTTPVGSFPANPWGLYDMAGNVWEWCADWYDENYYSQSAASKDPQGPERTSARVLRGGSWFSSPQYCRSGSRGRGAPGSRSDDVGFRVALDLE